MGFELDVAAGHRGCYKLQQQHGSCVCELGSGAQMGQKRSGKNPKQTHTSSLLQLNVMHVFFQDMTKLIVGLDCGC